MPKTKLGSTPIQLSHIRVPSLVEKTIRGRIEIDQHAADSGYEGDRAFFVVDLGEVYKQHRRWKTELPQVQPYYAVKCNPDPRLVLFLSKLGIGFDCASVDEMKLVLNLVPDPSRIIFSNPCKSDYSIRFAADAGVRMMSFDNLDELDKIKKFYPDAHLLLRIFASDPTALVHLESKYGASLDSTKTLLKHAFTLKLTVVGVSFHVGSGAGDVAAIGQAVKDSSLVLEEARSVGFKPHILNVGGGFQDSNFELISNALRTALQGEVLENITIIAEPGRYFARSAYTLICTVIGRRQVCNGSMDMIYQNDGVYGNFLNVIIEKEAIAPSMVLLINQKERQLTTRLYSIWGPTCDSTDCVNPSSRFGTEIMAGDWLIYKNMGGSVPNTPL
ncbi:hypothetical protein V490_01343 [Pseudogymnoascus sp. VKM F-3557]|nr:hypothetical protein V490_01343 [Pseudogymnoascus sp. VKM F-3557]